MDVSGVDALRYLITVAIGMALYFAWQWWGRP